MFYTLIVPLLKCHNHDMVSSGSWIFKELARACIPDNSEIAESANFLDMFRRAK